MTRDRIDIASLTLADRITGDDDEDTAMLLSMSEEAAEFIRSFEWCPPIAQHYLGFGVGGIVAVFLFTFKERIDADHDACWVVVGDLPSAYLVTDEAKTPKQALTAYCRLMQEWADAVLNGQPLDDAYPVEAPPTEEHAKMLLSRLSFIQNDIIPVCP